MKQQSTSFVLVKDKNDINSIRLVYFDLNDLSKDHTIKLDEDLSKLVYYDNGIIPIKGINEYEINCGKNKIGTKYKRCAYHELGCNGDYDHALMIADEVFEHLTNKGWVYNINELVVDGRKEIYFEE